MKKLILVLCLFLPFFLHAQDGDVKNVKKILLEYEMKAWSYYLEAKGVKGFDFKKDRKEKLGNILKGKEFDANKVDLISTRSTSYFKGLSSNSDDDKDLKTTINKIAELSEKSKNKVKNLFIEIENDVNLLGSMHYQGNSRNVENIVNKINEKQSISEISKLKGDDYTNITNLAKISNILSSDKPDKKLIEREIEKWNSNSDYKLDGENILSHLKVEKEEPTEEHTEQPDEKPLTFYEQLKQKINWVLGGFLFGMIPLIIKLIYDKFSKKEKPKPVEETFTNSHSKSSGSKNYEVKSRVLEGQLNSANAKVTLLQRENDQLKSSRQRGKPQNSQQKPTLPPPIQKTQVPTENFYILDTGDGSGFMESDFIKSAEENHFYVLEVEGDSGFFTITENQEMQKLAAISANEILQSFCNYENRPSETKIGIRNTKLGLIQKEETSGR